MSNLDRIYAKQSTVAGRAAAKLALFLAAITLAAWMKWGSTFPVKFLLVCTVIAAGQAVLEPVNAWRLRRKDRLSQPAPTIEQKKTPTSTFEATTDDEGIERLERRIDIGGQLVRVQIPMKLFPQAVPMATQLCERASDLALQWERFKAREARRLPRFAEEIMGLRLAQIEFYDGTNAEVSFSEESGGGGWRTKWDGMEFGALEEVG